MGLFRRSTDTSTATPATDTQLREIGRLVNEGRLDDAQRVADSTSDPRGAAFAAFRYIDLADD